MRSIGRLIALLLKQTVKQAKCDSTGHRKKKRQKQASSALMLRLLVASLSRPFSLRCSVTRATLGSGRETSLS
jgi:hypothetical protein